VFVTQGNGFIQLIKNIDQLLMLFVYGRYADIELVIPGNNGHGCNG
jgi:hypothetical protein